MSYISWVRKRIIDLNNLSASKSNKSLIESIEINLQAVELKDHYEDEDSASELLNKMQELVLTILNMPLNGQESDGYKQLSLHSVNKFRINFFQYRQ